MDRFPRVASVAAAAVVGLAFGGGVVWRVHGTSGERDDPVRAVRSPCNLAPAEPLDEALPGAVVVSSSGSGEPGEAWSASRECALAPKGTAEPALTLRLTRYGAHREDTDPGKRERIVVRPGAERAAREFAAGLSDDYGICRLRTVTGIGEQAAACAGTYYDGQSPAYRLLARRGDLVLSVVGVAGTAARREPLGRLAAGVLEAGR
ncbi:hypothetical protein ABZ801_10295 [Actinomadura sp. NPDC047616]|uniref:hypothetical protein n=1 Tax=Actinomadura sp. NPDC047616 TaxID=3155914 RepID=UPI00340FA3E3